jgi:hypothetical protein
MTAWDIIKFIAESIADRLSTIFSFIINIVFSVLDQVIKFYFNIINTIFHDHPSIFIITLIILCSIYIYKVKNYKLNNFFNKKVILNTLAIFLILLPLITFFIGSISNYTTSNNDIEQSKLVIKDKNISKPILTKVIKNDINITQIINNKISEQNKLFEKKLKLQKDGYDITIQTLEQTIKSLNSSLKIVEKRLYEHDNDFSFYNQKINLLKKQINQNKDNNLTETIK